MSDIRHFNTLMSEDKTMTIKELINELNELINNGEVNENAKVINADADEIFSIINNNEEEIVIYF